MKGRDVGISLTLFLLATIPAHAYGDPSGGTLFQFLMPTIACFWALWMILANRVRKSILVLYRKLRGMEPEEPMG